MLVADLPPITVVSFEAIKSLMYYALRAPLGAIAEVGVYKGGSAWFLAKLGRPLFLYDTFEGIPFQGHLDGNAVGKFGDTSVEAVQAAIPSATVIKGLFPASIVPMPPLGFVHVDCDQYESVKACLDVFPALMVPGGFMLFDDFGVDDCRGATAAVCESGRPILRIAETGKALVIV